MLPLKNYNSKRKQELQPRKSQTATASMKTVHGNCVFKEIQQRKFIKLMTLNQKFVCEYMSVVGNSDFMRGIFCHHETETPSKSDSHLTKDVMNDKLYCPKLTV